MTNPLQELFGFAKENKITRKDFLETRKLLVGKSLFGKLRKVKEKLKELDRDTIKA